jgi:hypothetical protein
VQLVGGANRAPDAGIHPGASRGGRIRSILVAAQTEVLGVFDVVAPFELGPQFQPRRARQKFGIADGRAPR